MREYGPFDGIDKIAGVTHDGQRVWAATGGKLIAFDPASGKLARSLDCACDAGTAFDGKYLYQIAEQRIDKIDPADGKVVAVDTRARPRRLRHGLGRGQPVGGAVPGAQDPPDRSRHRRADPQHRFQPLRHRRDLGRWRAVARHVGGDDDSDIRHIDPQTGAVLERLEMPAGYRRQRPRNPTAPACLLWAGESGKVRAVRRPAN